MAEESNISTNATWAEEYTGSGGMELPEAGRIIYRIILPIICAFGILGIILTVIVLSRKNMATSTNCFLMALSIADLVFLFLFATSLADNLFTQQSKPYYIYVIYVTYATIFMHICMLASIWLTVMLAVERFVAICRPFLAVKWLTISRARLAIVLIFISALICRLPNFWENRIVTLYDSDINNTLHFMEVTDLSINEHYIVLYPWIIDGVLTSMVPFVLLLLLNVRLIWEVRKSTEYLQRQIPRGSCGITVVHKEELQITSMLISVIMVFFVCQAPYVIYTAIVSITKFRAPSRSFMLFRYITMLLLVLKSAINFILYCWFSEKFWMTLKRLVCMDQCLEKHCWHRDDHPDHTDLLKMKRYSSCTTTRATVVI